MSDAGGVESAIVKEGVFVTSLKRNNTKIKEDRAENIAEDAEMTYKRHCEDLRMRIKRKTRDRMNMLDMSADTTYSLIVAGNFDATEFVKVDSELGLELRNLNIQLEICEESYTNLFGGV